MRSNLNLYNKELKPMAIEALGLYGLDLIISAPTYRQMQEVLDSGHVIVLDKQLEPRNMQADFFFTADNLQDSILLKDQLFNILSDEVYIEHSKVPGKLWPVHVVGWTPERINLLVQRMVVPLICTDGHAQSINIKKESFTTTKFNFNNQGNVKIDMRTQTDTTITFRGQSSSLVIRNKTTGDTWSYNGTTTATDEIKLIGVQSFKNNQSIFANTNKKMIDIATGNNEFEISGASGAFTLEISTRFYFL